MSEGAQSKPHPKKDGTAKVKTVGMAARVHDREREKSLQHTCESDKRDRDTSFSKRSQRNRCITYHTVVLDRAVAVSQENRERHGDQGPRSGRVSQKVSSKSADQVVRRSRVQHSSAGVDHPASRVALNQHKMELEAQTRREVAHEAARKQHDVDDDDQKIFVKREEANERGRTDEPKPREETGITSRRRRRA